MIFPSLRTGRTCSSFLFPAFLSLATAATAAAQAAPTETTAHRDGAPHIDTTAATADARADHGSAPPQQPQDSGAQPSSPLTLHVGNADLLLGGFMDASVIMRSTNPGTGIGTSFGSIPFTTTATGTPNPAGNLSETRFSSQNSRLSLQATSKVGGADLKGYIEADFLGNTSTNLNVTSNSNTLRMRLYWAQYRRGKFEFLAGQSWSMMTPNRNGISPMPGDLFYSQDVDTNYQAGLVWERTTGFRFVAHANDLVTAGVALENPEQYVGGAVVLPAAFAASQVDTGASALGSASSVPNRYPDIIGKVALDPKTGSTHQHIDVGVVVRGYKTYNPATDTSYGTTGTAESVNVVLEPIKTVHIVATNFFSNGGGRYIANTNIPDFIVTGNQDMTLVKSWSGIYGLEYQAVPNSLVYGYYSIVHADPEVTLDANGTTPIGYGIPGSQAANRRVTETTVGLTQTLFRDPKVGGLQLMLQYSNVQRKPFSVPANTPTTAKMNMVYVNVRYLLP